MRMRRPGWEALYAQRISDALKLDFIWGKSDCCMWTCDWIRDVRSDGADPIAEFRGVYHSLGGVLRMVKPYGGIAQCITRKFLDCGFELWPRAMAQRGDVALMQGGPLVRVVDGAPDMPFLGIVCGANVACLTLPRGIISVPLESAVMTWAI